MRATSIVLLSLLLFGCYSNPRTWVEWNGHQAIQYHESGHGWTEKGYSSVIECDWVDLSISPVNQMEYCPSKRRGTETQLAQAFDSNLRTFVPAAIHGLAFIAGMVAFPLLMPVTSITQNATFAQAQTSSTLSNGPVSIFRTP